MTAESHAKTPDQPATPSRARGRPRGSGAPPERLKSATIRVRATAEQAAAFDSALGPDWLRKQCDRIIRRGKRQ